MSAINLGGLAIATKKKGEAKAKPFLPDPTGELLPLVSSSIENMKAIAAREGTVKTAKVQLGAAAFSHACRIYAGRDSGIEHTFQLGNAEGKLLVSMLNKYTLPPDLASVKHILGDHAELVKESIVIEIDSEAMPSFIQQVFVDELVKLARQMDAMLGTPEGTDGAVFQAISVKPVKTLDKSFHEKRFALLSPEANAAIHREMPCQINCKFEY